MNEPLSVGFLGFGEAGWAIAKGLHAEGVREIFLCHRRRDDPGRSTRVKERAREIGAAYLESTEEVAKKSDLLLSVVSPDASVNVAREAVPHLGPGKTYLDLTSSFPDDMKSIAALLEPTGAKFVDGAMMGVLPISGHRVLIYVAGPDAEDTARFLNRWGMNLQAVGRDPGRASAIKLILSISTKGLESILVEMLLAARRYEAEEQVIEAFQHFFSMGLEASVNRLVGSDAVHAGRRIKEMDSSVRLLRNGGIDPIMTEAIVRRLTWSASLGLNEYFKGISPGGYKDVIRAWEEIGLFPGRGDE